MPFGLMHASATFAEGAEVVGQSFLGVILV